VPRIALVATLLALLGAEAVASPVAAAPAARPTRVYLVPLGEVSALDHEALASHYRERLGIPIAVLPAVPLTDEQLDRRRDLLVAEALMTARTVDQ
jgi:hypothetical protein